MVATPEIDQSDDPAHSQAWSINTELLWDILVFEKSGCESRAGDHSIFGSTLIRDDEEGDRDSHAEFSLIGSAGLYGHKTAARGTPIYPPNKTATPLGKPSYPFPGSHVEDICNGGILGDSSWENNPFLDVTQYGQAIDSWLAYDVQ